MNYSVNDLNQWERPKMILYQRKVNRVLLPGLVFLGLTLLSTLLLAGSISPRLKAGEQKKTSVPQLSFYGLYDSFKFNSTSNGFYNRYNGNAKFTSLGGDNFVFHGFNTGLNISNVQTYIDTNALLTTTLQNNKTRIGNTALNIHAGRLLTKTHYLDVYAGYGYSLFGIHSTLSDTTSSSAGVSGTTHFTGYNYYVGTRISNSWIYRKFILQGGASYVYSNFAQPLYIISYADGSNTNVPSVTTKIGLVTESGQVSYSLKNNVVPYVTAGLMQVVNRNYSTGRLINLATSSALPQLTLPDNGFFAGAGITFVFGHFRLTPYYQHAERGSFFKDNLGSLKIDFLCS